MNYLSSENLTKSYGDRTLFRNLTFGISRGDKIAIVGANGSGKTTLLSILAGAMPPDAGLVSVRKDISIGYLDQQPDFNDALTVMEAVLAGESAQLDAVRAYELALASENHVGLEKAMADMEKLEAWDYEAQIRQILGELGIQDIEQRVSSLSGGQRKRVALARVLIQNPDLLILDEPTNHLDLEAIEYLENFLTTSNGTLLMVSHDRYFLDRVCNQIAEMDNGQLYSYKGNYAYFLEKKEEREMAAASELAKDRNTFRRELEWMRRQPKARSTKAQYRIDAFDDLKEKTSGKKADGDLDLNLRMARLGSKILEVENLSKRFGDKVLLDHFTYTFKRPDRVGLIGKNGMGKTTLMNMLTGELRPDSGKISTGGTVKFGYYTQTELDLPENQRVIDVVQDVAEVMKLANGDTITATQLLSRFLFDRSKQYDFVAKLSGGEKRRLQLLLVLVQNPNFLILDEPTNDLDIMTLNVLEDFLLNFAGCVLIVTHDRYFMDRLVEHVFVLEGEGKVRDYPGNYTDYREWRDSKPRTDGRADTRPSGTILQEQAPKVATPAPVNGNANGAKRKPSFKEIKEYETLEAEIETLEKRKVEITELLNSGGHHEQLTAWAREIEEIDQTVARKSDRWLELAEYM
ncbi:ABC-F family ATP-binding cassette domain-containing protein [Spirosoma utsteinense]|uniref:ATP-binding cassette subfamily F protein uup n=1 Tax=Spirosoma utsteinense TaxID=2585773 RepID=A0ABR6WFD4_9BACT|nr:ABC-F family ATP-binding cassette domain-containing protein [Spirosoma utsteinense]MBC3784465.1 ATP-binding cassette subfamily F protein uup [Spirosoma utsteinense]MBC3794710.1 ATP-binding cassette subfamily F protein uup [Spirosoma utsteinense]